MNGKPFGRLDLDSAVAMLQGGAAFGDVFPCVDPGDRDALRRAFCFDPNCGPRPLSKKAPAVPQVTTGDACKKCGGMLVRAGKCLYCPLGCGSEGECS